MRVEVWAVDRSEYDSNSTCIWAGELDCIPRKGEIIFIFDGCGGVPVHHVYWTLDEKPSVEIGIDDPSGEYRKEAKKRGKS